MDPAELGLVSIAALSGGIELPKAERVKAVVRALAENEITLDDLPPEMLGKLAQANTVRALSTTSTER